MLSDLLLQMQASSSMPASRDRQTLRQKPLPKGTLLMTRMPAAIIMTMIMAMATTAASTMNTRAVIVGMVIVRVITAAEINVDDSIGLRGCKGRGCKESCIYSGPLVGDHYNIFNISPCRNQNHFWKTTQSFHYPVTLLFLTFDGL